MNCQLCDRVKTIKEGKYSFLIHEFKHSYFMLGEHQFFQGYSLIVTKNHFKEMTNVPSQIREELFKEMMQAHQMIEEVFRPEKMNLCSLGNRCPHVHWHFFPRYAEDPQFYDPPWLRMKDFDSARIGPNEAAQTIEKIKSSRSFKDL